MLLHMYLKDGPWMDFARAPSEKTQVNRNRSHKWAKIEVTSDPSTNFAAAAEEKVSSTPICEFPKDLPAFSSEKTCFKYARNTSNQKYFASLRYPKTKLSGNGFNTRCWTWPGRSSAGRLPTQCLSLHVLLRCCGIAELSDGWSVSESSDHITVMITK